MVVGEICIEEALVEERIGTDIRSTFAGVVGE